MLLPMKSLNIGSAACVALLVSACTVQQSPYGQSSPQQSQYSAPTPQSMVPESALGLWMTNFGAVKIERDSSRGGDAVMGVWRYERGGQEVFGFFAGTLSGNVLSFSWHDPAEPRAYVGEGHVEFAADGSRFSGRLWTSDRRNQYQWKGWRHQGQPPNPSYGAGDSYGQAGGQSGGDPYRRNY